MKKTYILFLSLIVFTLTGLSQTLEQFDKIAPFHEGLAAVKKGDQWAFINLKGDLVIDYRNDLVWNPKATSLASVTKEDAAYPYFSNGRCLIKKTHDQVTYFGYIDQSGSTIIVPQYIDASNFEKGRAIVLVLYEIELGRNDVLDKKVIDYEYNEVAIDTNGEIVGYLRGPEHLVLKSILNPIPKIQSYIVSSDLAAVMNKSGKWQLKELKKIE